MGHARTGERAFADAQAQPLRQRGGLHRPADTEPQQQPLQRQVVGAMHPGLHFGSHRAAGHLRDRLHDVGFVDRPAAAALPQQSHHFVERAAARSAQAQVERQRHQRALGVVADGGVGRVLVAAVVLDPGVETGLRHALHAAPRRGQHTAERLAQQAEVAGFVDQPGAQQQQVVVVRSEALEEPQQLGVVLLRVVVRLELARLQPLHVPGVKVLVADQAQQHHVAVAQLGLAALRQLAPGRNQRRAVAVFKPAVAVVDRVQHEHIARLRRLLAAMPEADFCFADALRIGQQAVAVEVGQRTGHHELVRHALRAELAAPERAQFHRVVDQFVVVGGLEDSLTAGHARHRAHRGRHLPAFRQRAELHALRLGLAPFDAQEHAGAVEEAALRIQESRAHRGVEGIHQVAHHQRRAAGAFDLPAGFVELAHGQHAGALLRRQRRNMAGKFAHQVAAGNPHRQAQPLLRGRLRNGEGDAEQVRVRVFDFDAVADHEKLELNCRPRRRNNSGWPRPSSESAA